MEITPKETSLPKRLGHLFVKRGWLIICFLISSMAVTWSQTNTINGVVTDTFGDPLIGVNVRIQGTLTGTITNIDGEYTLTAEPGNILEFSYVGMRSQTITVGTESTINVVLEEDNNVLAETVVIGYGVQRKADLTGSIASINTEEILRQPALNAVQSIQGKVSGVNIVSSDAPGASPTVIVRGLGTALGGRNPLYIVDGFPVDNIQNINSADIASIDILKDASSASIYGVRAANGVILVTTKKGKQGSSQINVESYVGIKNILNKVKMADASQYIEYFNENQASIGADWRLANVGQQAYNTDWYDELIKTGVTTNNVVSLSGGTDRVDYFFSYNFYDEKGILDEQGYKRTTIRNNNVYKFFDNRLRFTQNLNISFSKDNPKPYGAFNEAYRQSPLVPTRYANGRYGQPFVNTSTGVVTYERGENENVGSLNSIGNPLFNIDNYNRQTNNLIIQGGMEGELRLTDFLKFNSRLGATKEYISTRVYDNIRYRWLNTDPTRTLDEFNQYKANDPSVTTYANNSLELIDVERFRWIWENYLTFNHRFDRHSVDVILGTSREKTDVGKRSRLLGYDVPEKSQYWNLNFAGDSYEKTVEHYNYTPRALISYFGRIQYNFDNKYYFSGTLRRDGSSTFRSSGDYWGTFPSVGLGWTLSREEFMESNEWLEYFKLRGTWGKLGNQDVPLNVSQVLSDPTSSNYNYVFGPDQTLVYGSAFGTPAIGLTWEITNEWGVGFDFTVLENRLSGNFDFYEKRNTNTILNVNPILNSPYSDRYYAHGAKVLNRGVEVGLTWSDFLPMGLSYEIGINYSYNKNEVTEVNTGFNGATGGSLANGEITKRLQEGQPIYAWWMYEAEGIWQTQEEIDNNPHIGSPRPGYIRYKDQNGDGVIDDRDKIYLGSYIPSSNYGIHIGLGYKNFDFSMDGYGVAGNKIYNGLKGTRINGGENIPYDAYRDRWTGAGSTNTHPGAARDAYPSDYYLESGSYFRMNNMTLGYTFENLVFNGTRLRLYFTAQNPFIITKYTGFSPEITGYNGNPDDANQTGDPSLTTGVELSAYPTTRNFIFGLNLQF